MLINGTWTQSAATRGFAVINPATGAVIEEVANGGRAEADAAIDAAHEALAGVAGDHRLRTLGDPL